MPTQLSKEPGFIRLYQYVEALDATIAGFALTCRKISLKKSGRRILCVEESEQRPIRRTVPSQN